MPTRFCILGAGAWGITVSLVLAESSDHLVSLWCARPETAQQWISLRENHRHLPGIVIPEAIRLTTEISYAVAGADLVIVAIPTIHLRPTLQRIASELPDGCPLLSLVKGIERDTFLRPTEVVQQLTGPRAVAVLSGPSHAEEVSRGLPTSVVVASEDLTLARWIQERFSTERFRVYTNLDPIGVELSGALKNIIGLAAGMCDGLQLGDNAKAALLTRGLAEMARFGVALGAESQTFQGLAGMGDLITTCMSRHGRNRQVGERLAKGETLQNVTGGMTMVAEGVYTTRSVYEKAKQMGIAMPITSMVYRILYEDKSLKEAVTELMLRAPKAEK